MNNKSFVFFGPPGSGKGTQASLLGRTLGVPTISLGELLRKERTEGTPLGKSVEEYLKSGRLVPDEVVGDIVKERLNKEDVQGGFILDGYPRTENQLEHLKKTLPNFDNIYFIFLDVGDKEIVNRLSGRRHCSCGETYHLIFNPPKQENVCDICGKELRMRDDDKPETIMHRLELYHRETKPVIQNLLKSGKIIHINGEQKITEIEKEMKEKINNF